MSFHSISLKYHSKVNMPNKTNLITNMSTKKIMKTDKVLEEKY